MAMTYFHEHSYFILQVTAVLNMLKTPEGFYLDVSLHEAETHQKIGEWSDEITPDAWYYQEVE